MKRSTIFLTVLAASLCFGGSTVLAQRGGGGPPAGGAGGDHRSSGDRSGPNSERGGRKSSALGGTKTASEMLAKNKKLAAKLQPLLPSGMTLENAAAGFKNLGQFVAALHVCHNLGIPFDQLKAKMTDPPRESLGKAIHDLKPDVSAKTEAKKGFKEANTDLKESESSS